MVQVVAIANPTLVLILAHTLAHWKEQGPDDCQGPVSLCGVKSSWPPVDGGGGWKVFAGGGQGAEGEREGRQVPAVTAVEP